jgi:hypothetical protein
MRPGRRPRLRAPARSRAGFFLPPQPSALQRPADHRRAELPADPLGQHARVLSQGRIRPLSHEGGQHPRIRPAQHGRAAAAAQRSAAALPRLPKPGVHRADRNREPIRQNTLAALASIMRGQHALS